MSAAPPTARRHDLDALRGIAMLLGIALHAMISFIPGIGGGWAVADTQTSDGFGVIMAAIHGFRMPLFFVISGFFTMMLYRKRGLWALLVHRAKRILLPLLIGMVTIIPAVWAVSIYVGMASAWSDGAKKEKVEEVEASASGWGFAARGDVDELKEWISNGGDVHHREDDGATALHGAFLFGQVEAAQILIEGGADPNAVNRRGESSKDMLSVQWGITQYIAGLVGVSVEEASVMQGRRELANRLQLPNANQIGVIDSPSAKVMFALFYWPLFHHLWFLWFLCWLVVGFGLLVGILRLFKLTLSVDWMTASPIRYLWVVPATMLVQSLMSGDIQAFGPDTSIGLLPIPAVLGYYAIFFLTGALYFDATSQSSQQAARPVAPDAVESWCSIFISMVVLFPLGLYALEQSSETWRWVGLFAQASYAWLMTFGSIGVFSRLLAQESRVMRYLSDSSYWLYLVHIPLVILLQFFVREYAISPYLKFLGITMVASLILLVSYHLFVRYTPIGTLLNGRRLDWRNAFSLGRTSGDGVSQGKSTESIDAAVS